MVKKIALVSTNVEIVCGFRSLFSSLCKIAVFTSLADVKDATLVLDYILVDFCVAQNNQRDMDFFLLGHSAPVYVIMLQAGLLGQKHYHARPILSFPEDMPLLFQRESNSWTDRLSSAQQQVLARFVGTSSAADAIRTQIVRAAQTDTPVLILGETGVGKGLVAELIHRLSARGNRAIKALNVTTIPDGLAESMLFGTVRGAFTDAVTREGVFESAQGTTLFLDEIGDLKRDIQAKLLSVIETGTFQSVGSSVEKRTDARLIFATNADLKASIARGNFRADVYYRISHTIIRIPPLRERLTDIVPLAKAYLAPRGKALSPFAAEVLTTFDWQGNVRQLYSCLERAATLTATDIIDVPHIVVD